MSSPGVNPGADPAAKVVVNVNAQNAILAVTYGHPERQLAGTCFHVHREDGKSYVLTALHVLDDLDKVGATPYVEGRPMLATLAPPKGYYANDMALLVTEALPDEVSVLALSGDISRGQPVVLWGNVPDPAGPTVFWAYGIDGHIRWGVGFLGQMAGAGSQGLGINIKTVDAILSGCIP